MSSSLYWVDHKCSHFTPLYECSEYRSSARNSQSRRIRSQSNHTSPGNYHGSSSSQYSEEQQRFSYPTGSGEFYRSGTSGERNSTENNGTTGFDGEDSYERELREYGYHQRERKEQQHKERSRSLSPRERCVILNFYLYIPEQPGPI